VIFPRWQNQIDTNGSIETLYRDYVDGTPVPIRQLIWSHPMQHPRLQTIDLIPSNITLLDIDLRLQASTKPATTIREVAETHINQRSILSRALSDVSDEYDYVLIDCPPNLYLATQNALYASDGYLVTLLPDHFSTVGVRFLDSRVSQLLRERSLAQQILDPGASGSPQLPFFLVFIRVNVTAGRQQITPRQQMAIVRGIPQFANRCFRTITEDYKDIREAADEQRPVYIHSPGSQNSTSYERMTDEFLQNFP
jgi:chromosome partitioning protein